MPKSKKKESSGGIRILIVDDDELFRRSLNKSLKKKYDVLSVPTGEEGIEVLSENSIDLLLLDITLPELDGVEVLKMVQDSHPDLPVLMLSALDHIPKVVETIRIGAFDYLVKPINMTDLYLSIDRALEAAKIKREVGQHRQIQLIKNQKYQLVGKSKAFEKLVEEVRTVAPSDSSILIEGETGTGKELVARAIHAQGQNPSGPFVAINCGAIPEELIESELFGHKGGAFTSARTDEIGKFRLANGGTLLLDEIGELPPLAQVKLLRVLEEEEFYPVGSTQLVEVKVRVLATTNRTLKTMVEEGTFREDLYFRLNVYRIEVPPLRDRKEDILEIGRYYLDVFNKKFRKEFTGFSKEAENLLISHPWKGNIRELRNIVERVVLSGTGGKVERKAIQFISSVPRPSFSTSISEFSLPKEGIDLEEFEKNLMEQALALTEGNKSQAARLLGLTPPTFYYRLEKYDLG